MEPVILYNNKLEDATITASSSAANYGADYLKDNKTYSYWKASLSGTNNITIDFGSETFIGALGIAAHNLNGASLKLYKSTNGSTWVSVISKFNVLEDNSILKLISEDAGQYIQYEDGDSIELEDGSGYIENEEGDSYTARYWKLEITSSFIPQIGVLYLGEYFKFDYPPESPVVPKRESVVAQSEISNGGHLLGTDVRYYQNTAQFLFRNITRSFYVSKLKIFWDTHAKLLKGFFFAWDLTNRPNDVFYCKISEDSTMQEPLSILSYVDEVNLNLQLLA